MCRVGSADRAELGGTHDGIVRGLVQGDIEGIGCAQRVGAPGIQRTLFGHDVEVLAQCYLSVHVGEAAGESTRIRFGQVQRLFVGLGARCREEEVSHENRGVAAKGP